MDDNKKQAEKIDQIRPSEILDHEEKNSKGISYKTVGTILQAVSVQLDEGESIYSESGKMSWMTKNMKMETKGRGLGKMVSRVFTGESLFLNHFTSLNGTGVITFSTDQAGKIIPIELKGDSPAVIFQRGAFLCAEKDIDLSIAFTRKLSAGMFGGKGWILQKIKGAGMAHLTSDGEVVMYELKEGQEMLVDQGNLVAYEETVDFDIQTVGGGAMNWFFGGEGIFHAVLRGPGKIWLQTRKTNLTSYSSNQSSSQQSSSNPLGCLIGIIISAGIIGTVLLVSILGALSSWARYLQICFI